MKFYKKIVEKSIQDEDTVIILKKEKFTAMVEEIAANQCCKALKEIRDILDDATLEDPECFERIEKIISVYEGMGLDGGCRHDFG